MPYWRSAGYLAVQRDTADETCLNWTNRAEKCINDTMKTLAAISILVTMLLATGDASAADKQGRFDPEQYLGKWDGGGKVLMPWTGMQVPFDGGAEFSRDSAGVIRTAFHGQTAGFNYSDSGRLIVDAETDSLTWDLWDSGGKHRRFLGVALGDILLGKGVRGGPIYTVTNEFIGSDSLNITVTSSDAKGVVRSLAILELRRQK